MEEEPFRSHLPGYLMSKIPNWLGLSRSAHNVALTEGDAW